ncbi:MAG: glycosyltransferase [Nitrosopumilus sp.]|nr:glycosyltransferase [Nitrosopumilus sp.]
MIDSNSIDITVLMPVYNAEKYLKQSIESILNQTFKNFEFLIIDDGSSDNSEIIIKGYKDKRIRFIKNEQNIGISATLNKGIELASCELITRMDADDISYPKRLEKQFNYFSKNPECALLSTWAKHINYEKKSWWINKYHSDYYYYSLIFNCWIYHPTVMYKRSAVMDVGMYSSKYSEDYNLWCKISRKYKIDNLKEVLLDYRSTTSSLSKVAKKKEYEDAHNEQILKNIQYYTGKETKLDQYEIQFLGGKTFPELKLWNKEKILNCFTKLDFITNCVEQTENVNKTSNEIIRKAAKAKKADIILKLHSSIKTEDFIALLIKLNNWKLVNNLASLKIKKIIKKLLPIKNLKEK